jgi:hypothetical protein
MTIKLDRDVRRVVVLGGDHPRRRIYDADRESRYDDDEGIRVTVLHRDQHGRLVGRERYESEGERRRKKQSPMLKPIERVLRRAIKFEARLLNDYLGRHERSNSKKRDGWIKDLSDNVRRSIRKSKPRYIIRGRD